MTLIVDASVAVKWFVREPLTDEARELLTIPDPLIAPDWLLVEVVSVFWRKVKRSELLWVYAKRHLEDLPSFFERLDSAVELTDAAFDWLMRMKHPVYHCLYFALAKREDQQLVTADVKFAEAIRRIGNGDQVRLLA